MMNQVEIYFSDLKPEAQQQILKAAGMTDAREGNFEISPLAILDYEVKYFPQVCDIVNVSSPPNSSCIWNHEFIGTVEAVNTEEGHATVVDGDGDHFDIDFEYLTKDESED